MLIDEFVENNENLTLQRFEFNLPGHFFQQEKNCVSENILVTYLKGNDISTITVKGFNYNQGKEKKSHFSYDIQGKCKLLFDDFIQNYQQSENKDLDVCKKNVFEFVLSNTICCNNELQSWKCNTETSELINSFLNQFKIQMREDLYDRYKEHKLYCCIYHMIFNY